MTVYSEHPLYTKTVDKWVFCRDFVEGENAVKSKEDTYLPRLGGMINTMQGNATYRNYLTRASFFGASGATVTNLTGLLFVKPALNTEYEAIPTDNIDGNKATLEGFNKQIVREQLITSRCCVWVNVDENGDPYARIYQPENFIDCDFDRDGNLVVVKLVYDVVNKLGDKPEMVKELRTLALINGVYTVADYRKNDNNEWVQKGGIVTPSTRNGTPLGYIPFRVAGALSFSFDIETPILMDLYNLNHKHYLNGADLEWYLHFLAPTPFGIGLTEEDAKVYKAGPTEFMYIPNHNAKLGLLEASGQGVTMLREAMKDKEDQMARLGSRMLELPKMGVESDATIGMRHAGDKTNLDTLSDVSVQMMRWVINTMHDFAGVELDQPEYMIDKSNLVGLLSPEYIEKLTSAYERNAISQRTMLYNFERGNLYPDGHTWEDEQELIAAGNDFEETGNE